MGISLGAAGSLHPACRAVRVSDLELDPGAIHLGHLQVDVILLHIHSSWASPSDMAALLRAAGQQAALGEQLTIWPTALPPQTPQLI